MECHAELIENLKCKPTVIAEQSRSLKPNSNQLTSSWEQRMEERTGSRESGTQWTPDARAEDRDE